MLLEVLAQLELEQVQLLRDCVADGIRVAHGNILSSNRLLRLLHVLNQLRVVDGIALPWDGVLGREELRVNL